MKMDSPFHKLLLALASRPQGVATADVESQGFTHAAVDHQIRRLAAKGFMHKAKLGHKTVRWFTTKAAAERAMDAANVHKARRYEKASASKFKLQDQGGEVQYHSDFKGVEQCPHFVPRFQGPTIVPMGLQRGRVML